MAIQIGNYNYKVVEDKMKKAKQCKLDLAKIKMCITHANGSQATDNCSPEICPHYNTDVRKVSESYEAFYWEKKYRFMLKI